MTIVEIIQLLVAIQRLVDTITNIAVNKVKTERREKLHEGVTELRVAMTTEAKVAALKKIRDSISGEASSGVVDSASKPD